MEIDTSNLTDEQISKLSEFIHTMEKENKATKWWIMPKYPIFSSEVQQFGQQYYVEPQEDTYSKSQPPLKCDFDSAEEAQKWLDDYLKEDDLFLKAIDEFNNLNCNLGHLVDKLHNHQYITSTDIHDCFKSFNASYNHGWIKEVTKK